MIVSRLAIAIVSVFLFSGCTTQLIEGQKQELQTYSEKGLEVQDKAPGVAAVLGIFPAAGYFYTGHYVLAITTLPLYVFAGPLWMPFDTYNAAESRNYFATKASVERQKAKEIRENDHEMEDKKIDYEQHIRNQRVIEDKFSAY